MRHGHVGPVTAAQASASQALLAWLQSVVDEGAMPGATWVVARGRKTLAVGMAGARCLEPRVVPLAEVDTVYDLASLTKPLATAALAVRLARTGHLRLDETVRTRVPELDGSPFASVSLLDLLLHRAGLPAWQPLFLHGNDMASYLRRMAALSPMAPAGERVIYSDLGYMLAGEIIARAGGRSLAALFDAEILARLLPPADEPCFTPPASWQPRVAPTEAGDAIHRGLAEHHAGRQAAAAWAGWSEGVLLGEVHDLNARALGGVAGHAGLFGSAAAVAALAAEFLPGSRLFEPDDLALFTTSQTPGLEQERSVGFRVSSAGFGHTGFTGPSLMLDPAHDGIYVLLTNRVHTQPLQIDLTAVRTGFHERAAALMEEPG